MGVATTSEICLLPKCTRLLLDKTFSAWGAGMMATVRETERLFSKPPLVLLLSKADPWFVRLPKGVLPEGRGFTADEDFIGMGV